MLLPLFLNKAYAQRPTPAPPQSKSILLKGGTVHVGDGTVIDDGAVGFRNGTIDFVGHSYGVKQTYDSIIVTDGQQIYPGFILPDNTLGLHEIDLVRATDDEDETGEMEPEVRAMAAFNVDSRIIPTVRSNGVLLTQATPRGGVISGQTVSTKQSLTLDPESKELIVERLVIVQHGYTLRGTRNYATVKDAFTRAGG